MAVVLVVTGAAVSPQGDPLEPRPPDTVWTATAEPGRAPGLWVLGERAVVTTANAVIAFDPTTGDPAWTLDLDDPACTATAETLTCVHGEGEDASIATIDPEGAATELPFPGADVAGSAGADVIVAGGTAGEDPWFGRFTTTSGSPDPVWQYSDAYVSGAGIRWNGATVSQGIATVSSAGGETGVDGAGPVDAGASLAADLETGEPRPAVVSTSGTTMVSTYGDIADQWDQIVQPMAGPEPAVPGHPEVVFTNRGAFDAYGGSRILEYLGSPLTAVGDDVVVAGPHPDATTFPEEGVDVDVAIRIESLDVPTGETRWQLDRDQLVGCPCAVSHETLVMSESTYTDVENFIISPVALLGVDLDSGRHEWSLPISTVPDAIAAGGDRAYVLTGSTLTAYEDR